MLLDSTATISKDVKAILAEWKEARLLSTEERILAELDRMLWVIEEATREGEIGKKEKTSRRRVKVRQIPYKENGIG